MSDAWRLDPTFAVCRELADGTPPSAFAGGPYDVRAVVASLRTGAKDGFLLDEIPWERFPHGDRVGEALRLLHTGALPVGADVVGSLCADDARAGAVLAVPFLIRIAADPRHPHRSLALAEASAPARARYVGRACRDTLLLHRSDGLDDADDDGYGYEVTGYPAAWSVAAARAAITADAGLLLPLLGDPAPANRVNAAYALATAADPDRTLRGAFLDRFGAEPDPTVRAALALATAEATRARPHPAATAWLRALWQDGAEAPEVRLAAAIGWLCVTDEPAPSRLRDAVDALATEERARAMDRALPWMSAASSSRETGLHRCVREILHPELPSPEPRFEDPWSAPAR
ncbi:hypothetical protein [Kitasatospora sp. NPDC101183]|uniref:hypothetical protein n=1 Tax=Kitasatospora sp. NPDC101183 TaxID=3364100 RepID=UPI00382D8ADB